MVTCDGLHGIKPRMNTEQPPPQPKESHHKDTKRRRIHTAKNVVDLCVLLCGEDRSVRSQENAQNPCQIAKDFPLSSTEQPSGNPMVSVILGVLVVRAVKPNLRKIPLIWRASSYYVSQGVGHDT